MQCAWKLIETLMASVYMWEFLHSDMKACIVEYSREFLVLEKCS